MIFTRYLALGSVNRLVLELRERNVRTKVRKLSNGGTRGGVLFTQGPLFYLLRNRFYIGEVLYISIKVRSALALSRRCSSASCLRPCRGD